MSTLRKTFYALTAAGLFGVFVAGCGGGSSGTNPPPPPTAHEVLFADSAAGIEAFSIDSSGMLDRSRIHTGLRPRPIHYWQYA